MKQSAVEWLVEEINKLNVSTEARAFINKLQKQAKQMESQQKDEFAIGFAEWCDLNATQKSVGLWFSIPLKIPLQDAKTTQELLEAYKKEKGL